MDEKLEVGAVRGASSARADEPLADPASKGGARGTDAADRDGLEGGEGGHGERGLEAGVEVGRQQKGIVIFPGLLFLFSLSTSTSGASLLLLLLLSLGARTLQRSRSDTTGRLVGEAGNNKRR